MAKELLKDVTIRNAKADKKDYRLNDGQGLYILIKPNGAKWWRFDYTFSLKRKTLSLGVYPETTLSDARRKAAETRNSIANDKDPSNIRKEKKAIQILTIENESRLNAGLTIIDSFEYIARKWGEKKVNDWQEKITAQKECSKEIYFLG